VINAGTKHGSEKALQLISKMKCRPFVTAAGRQFQLVADRPIADFVGGSHRPEPIPGGEEMLLRDKVINFGPQ
jgi:hypothetical protein